MQGDHHYSGSNTNPTNTNISGISISSAAVSSSASTTVTASSSLSSSTASSVIKKRHNAFNENNNNKNNNSSSRKRTNNNNNNNNNNNEEYGSYIPNNIVDDNIDKNNKNNNNNNNTEQKEKEKVLGIDFYFSRWMILGICTMGMYISGCGQCFGLIYGQVKDDLRYDHFQIDIVASTTNAGIYSSLFSGLILYHIGPRNSLLLGACLSSMGFFMMYLIVQHTIQYSNVTFMCLMTYMAYFGISFLSITFADVTIQNFPIEDRGKALGVVKTSGCIGIALNSTLYLTFFANHGNGIHYLLGLSIIVPSVISILASMVMKIPKAGIPYSDYELDKFSVLQKKNIIMIPTTEKQEQDKEQTKTTTTHLSDYDKEEQHIMDDNDNDIDMDENNNETQMERRMSFKPWIVLLLSLSVLNGIFGYFSNQFSTGVPDWLKMTVFWILVSISLSTVYYVPFLYGKTILLAPKKPTTATTTTTNNNNNNAIIVEEKNGDYDMDNNDYNDDHNDNDNNDDDDDDITSLLSKHNTSSSKTKQEEKAMINNNNNKKTGDFTPFEMTAEGSFWILFLIYFSIAGICLTVVNNIPTVVYDFFGKKHSDSLPVALYGIFEGLGRLAISLTDIQTVKYARIFFLDFIIIILFLVCLNLTNYNYASYLCSITILSFCWGSTYTIMPCLIADMYGKRHFAMNYGIIMIAPITASFLFSTGYVSLFSDLSGCNGYACFQFISLSVSLVAVIAYSLSLWLKYLVTGSLGFESINVLLKTFKLNIESYIKDIPFLQQR